jgi:ribosome biogenesis protein MAK21
MTDALFRIVHTAPFNTGVQALLLLLHVMTARNVLSDRFYRK